MPEVLATRPLNERLWRSESGRTRKVKVARRESNARVPPRQHSTANIVDRRRTAGKDGHVGHRDGVSNVVEKSLQSIENVRNIVVACTRLNTLSEDIEAIIDSGAACCVFEICAMTFPTDCVPRASEARCSGHPADRKLHMRPSEPSGGALRTARLDDSRVQRQRRRRSRWQGPKSQAQAIE